MAAGAAALPAELVVPELEAAATASLAGAALSKFTEAFSEELGKALAGKSADLLVDAVHSLIERISPSPRSVPDGQVQKEVCLQLRPGIQLAYLNVLVEKQVTPSSSTTLAKLSESGAAKLDPACALLGEIVLGLNQNADPATVTATIKLLVAFALVETEAPAGHTVEPATTAKTTIATSAKAPPQPARTANYLVKPGDSLWSIATGLLPRTADHRSVEDTWMRLWSANFPEIGSNPDVIHPGLRLTTALR